jgi:N-methylhydantoinase A/oxoprolinase/acetone carboxylase beta subunit
MSSRRTLIPEATRTFVDRGGTFTDVVHIAASGAVQIEKIPSDEAVAKAHPAYSSFRRALEIWSTLEICGARIYLMHEKQDLAPFVAL